MQQVRWLLLTAVRMQTNGLMLQSKLAQSPPANCWSSLHRQSPMSKNSASQEVCMGWGAHIYGGAYHFPNIMRHRGFNHSFSLGHGHAAARVTGHAKIRSFWCTRHFTSIIPSVAAAGKLFNRGLGLRCELLRICCDTASVDITGSDVVQKLALQMSKSDGSEVLFFIRQQMEHPPLRYLSDSRIKAAECQHYSRSLSMTIIT